jgi:hypothetical protein
MTNKKRINSPQKIARMVELTRSGKVLVVTLLFRLLFGGYLIGMDQYRFNDVESALTVLLIYGLIGLFATLFLLGIRYRLLACFRHRYRCCCNVAQSVYLVGANWLTKDCQHILGSAFAESPSVTVVSHTTVENRLSERIPWFSPVRVSAAPV